MAYQYIYMVVKFNSILWVRNLIDCICEMRDNIARILSHIHCESCKIRRRVSSQSKSHVGHYDVSMWIMFASTSFHSTFFWPSCHSTRRGEIYFFTLAQKLQMFIADTFLNERLKWKFHANVICIGLTYSICELLKLYMYYLLYHLLST